MDSSIYYVPEKKRKYYYASNGEYDTNMEPYLVNNYTLWANLNALDTITNPATVLVTELKGAKSYMYRVKFKNKAPDIFERAKQKDDEGVSQYVFFVPSDRFLRFESTNHCVPVPENNWEDYSFRFHALAAFYRLNVIPSLSMPLFEREDLFTEVCDEFYKKYHFGPPLNTALSSIFSSVFYALDFFGFLTPTSLTEKESFDAAKIMADSFLNQQWGTGKSKYKLTKMKNKRKKKRRSRRRRSDADSSMTLNLNDSSSDDNESTALFDVNDDAEVTFDSIRSFAFSEIKFGIERYHKECFPWRESKLGLPPDVFDRTSFCSLLNAIQKVRKGLTKLRLLPSDAVSTHDALRAGVIKFQELNNMPTGCCDLFTARRIWDASSTGECDTLALCRLCGMKTKEPEVPVYFNTLGELHVVTQPGSNSKDISSFSKKEEQIETVLNEAFARVRDRSEAQQLMMSEAQKSVEMQISRVDKSVETAKDIMKTAKIIEGKLDEARKKGSDAEIAFDSANEILDRIIEQHENIRKEFNHITKRIDEERNGNKLLFFVNMILLAIIIYRFVQCFKA